MTATLAAPRRIDCHGQAFGEPQRGVQRFLVGHLGPWLLVPGTNSSLERDARLLGGALGHLLVVAEGGGDDPTWASRSADIAVRALARHCSALIQHGVGADPDAAASGALGLALERWRRSALEQVDDPVGRQALAATGVAAAFISWPWMHLVTSGACVGGCLPGAGRELLRARHGDALTTQLGDDATVVLGSSLLSDRLADERWLRSAARLPEAASASAALAAGSAGGDGAVVVARVVGGAPVVPSSWPHPADPALP